MCFKLHFKLDKAYVVTYGCEINGRLPSLWLATLRIMFISATVLDIQQ